MTGRFGLAGDAKNGPNGRKTGPNDASDALFGPYVHVFFFPYVFFIINSYIIGSAYQITMEMGGDKGNGPNDMSDASFGPYVRVFFFLCVFLLLAHVL
jgi:hypothetical protein